MFELSLRFLTSPYDCWKSGRPEVQKLVLKLTLNKPLRYDRKTGCLNPEKSMLSRVLEDFQESEKRMVLPERFELSTSPLPRECSTPELRQRSRVRRAFRASRRRVYATAQPGAQGTNRISPKAFRTAPPLARKPLTRHSFSASRNRQDDGHDRGNTGHYPCPARAETRRGEARGRPRPAPASESGAPQGRPTGARPFPGPRKKAGITGGRTSDPIPPCLRRTAWLEGIGRGQPRTGPRLMQHRLTAVFLPPSS